MKSIKYILLFFLLSIQFIFSQWYEQNSGTSITLNSVFFVDEFNGWICGQGGIILHTENSGLDWYEQNSGILNDLKKIQFTDLDYGWAFSENDIIKTTDGGLNWIEIQNLPISDYISSMQFITQNTGWTVTHRNDSSFIYETTDGGNSWNIILQKDVTENFYTAFFLDDNTGWAPSCISLGILKTTNGGNNWMQFSADFECIPMNLQFINNLTGWISHNTLGSYIISKSIDGGETWSVQKTESNKIINSIHFLNTSIGYAVGFLQSFPTFQEIILSTADGGISWNEIISGTGELNSVFFVNDSLGWTVGLNGKILVKDDGGITSVSHIQFPTKFILYQNYPNPFNPSTTIKFTIPSVIASGAKQSQLVTLKVYDVLGNEIATLVNEEKPAGEYEVDFNSHSSEGGNLTSGIYFYKLQAGEYIETKKMVLMK